MEATSTENGILDALASRFHLEEAEHWRLLLQHFELTDTFAFVVVLAPDEWATRLFREQLARDLGDSGAVHRVRFSPRSDGGKLAEELLSLKSLPAKVRAVWIDADPTPADENPAVDAAWARALSRLNRYRNTIQDQVPCTVVLAGPVRLMEIVRREAPDFWSIRSSVFRIEAPGVHEDAFALLPREDRAAWDSEFDDVGDPEATLTEADKLRGKPGRELLLAALLTRAGRQMAHRLQWTRAINLLEEAYELEEAHGGDPDARLELLLSLASVFKTIADFPRAKFYGQRAVQLSEQHFGPSDGRTAVALNDVAQLLQDTNRLSEAEPLMRRALAIDEQSFGPEHPRVATDLNNLALLLQATNRLSEAEPLMRRALAIDEPSFGPEHFRVATDLNNLAQLLRDTNRLSEAEPLMRRALAIVEQSFGPEHPDVATHLSNLTLLLHVTNRLSEAEPLMRRALEIDEQCYGPEHPDVARDLNNLARLLQSTNRLLEAEPLMRRHVEIFLKFTKDTGYEHPHLRAALGNYVGLLKAMGRSEEEARAEVMGLVRASGVVLK